MRITLRETGNRSGRGPKTKTKIQKKPPHPANPAPPGARTRHDATGSISRVILAGYRRIRFSPLVTAEFTQFDIGIFPMGVNIIKNMPKAGFSPALCVMCRLLRLFQGVDHGIAEQLGAAAEAELFLDVLAMNLDGLGTEKQLLGDLLDR